MPLAPNTRLGRYEIRSQLGTGGMGEVYLALDAQLERTVALKVLPSDVASDGERMRRFVQEAKAAAALSHPNIAHIYEIGESEGTHFIAMEYIDGETLRAEIHNLKTPLHKLLKYLAQVAEGLAKAHAAGIVHRDLKPDNIMITRDGYAKILDFGLAKLTEPPKGFGSDGGSSEVATAILQQHSIPGMVMGTVGYMSPEQAQGRVKEIDYRSDIFSFGCILYEAATGRKAFAGKDVLDSLHMIVHAPTPQIKEVNSLAPDELQRIVRRCLAKEPDKRYQSIKDVAIELDELRQELKDKAGLEYSVHLESSSSESVSSPRQVKINSTQHSAVNTTRTDVTHTTSSAEYVVGEIKRHKRGVAVIALLLAIGGITFALYKFGWQDKPATAPAPFQAIKITKLTANGKATQAVIAPDGKQVVYVIDDGGRRSLWLRQVATATDVQLAAPEDVFYWSLTITPDGNFLYYVSGGTTLQNRVLYKMPVLGGTPRKLVEDVGSPISFSPDGKQIAFVRSGEAESALMIANADGTEERKLAARQRGEGNFGNFFQGGTAWSPDGKRIASIAHSIETDRGFQNVVEVPVEGGTERPLTSQKWHQIQRLAWLSDGSGLLMTAAEQASDFRAKQIWYLSYASGEARKITNDLSDYGSISLNADSSILVTVQADRDTNIWVAPDGDAGRATQLTSVSSELDGSVGVAWTPDGKIVYHSMAGGKEGIWIMDADGKNRRQLTTGETVDFYPSVSKDGRYVVFVSERTGRRNIWRMDVDGSNPKQLTDRGNYPQAAAEWVVYQAGRNLWKVPIDGGEPAKLGENMTWSGVSPDGKLIACVLNKTGYAFNDLAVLPIEGGSPVKVFDAQLRLPARIRWAPDGRAVTYLSQQNGIADIWSQPIDGGEPKKLTDFKADEIFSFDWSRDNKLVISHGSSTSDVVLIRDAK